MKKILALILCITLLCAIIVGCDDKGNGDEKSTTPPRITTTKASAEATTAPVEDLVENPASDFEYELNSDGSITIVKYIGHNEIVVIPDTIQNLNVTKLGYSAFRLNSATSVTMPDTIVEIENLCFYQCDKLKSIKLSQNLVKIGNYAFQDCTQLKHIIIPSQTNEIGDLAFSGSGLETVVFEEGIETISGYGSFSCTQLKELVLPSTVKEIGSSTFGANQNLESVVLNDGLVKIGHKAFVNNPKLKEIVIPKTVEVVTEMDFNMCSGLEKIMFEGNAPATFEYSDSISGVWKPYDVDFVVYYHSTAKGFTTPEWYGYTTKVW